MPFQEDKVPREPSLHCKFATKLQLYTQQSTQEKKVFLQALIQTVLVIQVNCKPDKVAQPYSPSNFTAGRGVSGGVNFQNIFALLKVGHTGSRDEHVKKVIFTDLSNRAVSGDFSVVWKEDEPVTVFPKNGAESSSRLKLDCAGGVNVAEGELAFFYLYIPAHHYTKEFEIKFVMSDGREVVKTV